MQQKFLFFPFRDILLFKYQFVDRFISYLHFLQIMIIFKTITFLLDWLFNVLILAQVKN